MVTSEYLPLLNKLKCGQHYYANPEVGISHLSNAVPEPESSPSGMTRAITVKSCVRTFDCGANWQSLEPVVTAVFDLPDLVPTAPAFDVARGLLGDCSCRRRADCSGL
jgi:hypothetical protein